MPCPYLSSIGNETAQCVGVLAHPGELDDSLRQPTA
jgi:hypothetical protein